MKSLTVKPHWAALIESGVKTIEIRSRRCTYRGPLLICTSARGKDVPGVPKGVTLCIVEVIDSRRMEPGDVAAAGGVPFDATKHSWILSNPRSVERVAVKGQLNFFETPDSKITARRAA